MKFPTEINEDLAEETGWHIGDGSMNYYNSGGRMKGLYSLRGHLKDDRAHYETRIKPFFKRLYDLDIPIHEMPITGVFGFQVWNSKLIEFKESLGLPLGRKGKTLNIPEKFLTSNKLKEAIIRGIFDTDGCVSIIHKNHKLYPRIIISTISPILANQLKETSLSLGLRATLHARFHKNHPNWSQIFTIHIRGDEMFHKFMQIVQPKNPKHIAKYEFYVKDKEEREAKKAL